MSSSYSASFFAPTRSARSALCVLLIASSTLMLSPATASAAMVSTEEATGDLHPHDAGDLARLKVQAFLQREQVRQALVAQGAEPTALQARVAAMTDEEVAQLADRVDQAPAGGDVLGLVFTLFIVLLVTDILGFTKVFPFTRSVR